MSKLLSTATKPHILYKVEQIFDIFFDEKSKCKLHVIFYFRNIVTFQIFFYNDNVIGGVGGQGNSSIHCYKELKLNGKIRTLNGEPGGI